MIVTINVGSSSLKVGRFDGTQALQSLALPHSSDSLSQQVVELVRRWLCEHREIHAIGHRLVHGGAEFTAPTWVTPAVLLRLQTLAELAPIHMKPALAVIEALAEQYPHVRQYACFDTAFHSTLPETERRLPIPREYHDQGFRRYGFHGLSYESIALQLQKHEPKPANGRVVVAHLGSGASVCGMLNGRSQTTSMGYTPLDGVLMATRPGRLDAGVVLQLLRRGLSVDQVEDMLDHHSGLLGISGITGDMQKLLNSGESSAKLAVEMFVVSVAKEVAAAATVLGGIELLVFTGGIGEHSEPIRERVTGKLRWLGEFAVRVYPAQEETLLAIHGQQLLSESPDASQNPL
ncbi:MAG: acetate/propionate family kinase [Fimbriiglobus sp.]